MCGGCAQLIYSETHIALPNHNMRSINGEPNTKTIELKNSRDKVITSTAIIITSCWSRVDQIYFGHKKSHPKVTYFNLNSLKVRCFIGWSLEGSLTAVKSDGPTNDTILNSSALITLRWRSHSASVWVRGASQQVFNRWAKILDHTTHVQMG